MARFIILFTLQPRLRLNEEPAIVPEDGRRSILTAYFTFTAGGHAIAIRGRIRHLGS